MKRFIALSLVFLIFVCCFSGCKQQVITIEEEIEVSGSDVTDVSDNETETEEQSSSDNKPTGNSGGSGGNKTPTTSNGSPSQSTNNGGGGNAPTDSNESSEPTYSVNIGTQSDIDFKGATVTIASYSQTLEPKKTSKTYDLETELIRQIEEKYNCKIEYRCIADSVVYYSSFCIQAMAGTKFADIAKLPGEQSFPNAALEGYVRCLDGKFDWNSDMFVKKLNNEVLTLKNKHYYLALKDNALSLTGNGIAFRKSLFLKFNIADPYYHVLVDNWTWDTFLETCKQMTRKVGYDQYYGMPTASIMFSSNNVKTAYREAEGKYRFNLNSPDAIECIEFGKKLYDLGYVPEWNGSSLWDAERVAMTPASWYLLDGDEDVGFVYYPKGPKANDYAYNSANMPLVVVPSGVKDSEFDGVCEIIKDFFGAYNWKPTVKEQLKQYTDDEKALDILTDTAQRAMNANYWDTYYAFISHEILWTDYGISTGTEPKAFMDSVKDRAQEEIDDTWEKYSQLP